jgi:hypothetical protein
VLGVLAVAVLVVALVVTGRSLSGRGTRPSAQPPPTAAADAPYRIGDRVTCPLAHPVLATADGRSYPPALPRAGGSGAWSWWPACTATPP